MRRLKKGFVLMLALILVIGAGCVTGVAQNDENAKDVALTFIKEVYSDFRTIKNDGEFNQKVESEVSETAKDVKQYVKDRKKLRLQQSLPAGCSCFGKFLPIQEY